MANKETDPISLDMTDATSMEPLPDNTTVLCVVSEFKLRKSSQGNPMAHVELTVLKPEDSGIKNRKLFDDINLENVFTKGRLLNLLKGLGFEEKTIRSKTFKLDPTELVGMQCTVVVGIRASEQYGDRNTIKRVRSAESFSTAD